MERTVVMTNPELITDGMMLKFPQLDREVAKRYTKEYIIQEAARVHMSNYLNMIAHTYSANELIGNDSEAKDMITIPTGTGHQLNSTEVKIGSYDTEKLRKKMMDSEAQKTYTPSSREVKLLKIHTNNIMSARQGNGWHTMRIKGVNVLNQEETFDLSARYTDKCTVGYTYIQVRQNSYGDDNSFSKTYLKHIDRHLYFLSVSTSDICFALHNNNGIFSFVGLTDNINASPIDGSSSRNDSQDDEPSQGNRSRQHPNSSPGSNNSPAKTNNPSTSHNNTHTNNTTYGNKRNDDTHTNTNTSDYEESTSSDTTHTTYTTQTESNSSQKSTVSNSSLKRRFRAEFKLAEDKHSLLSTAEKAHKEANYVAHKCAKYKIKHGLKTKKPKNNKKKTTKSTTSSSSSQQTHTDTYVCTRKCTQHQNNEADSSSTTTAASLPSLTKSDSDSEQNICDQCACHSRRTKW
jgi:hypothetical protein